MKEQILGLVRETKDPPDKRVALTPLQCKHLMVRHRNLCIVVQPSATRCFTDKEYADAGIRIREDLSECDILMGVKEVAIDRLIPGKTYLFFSHTAKKQAYNRGLLQAIVEKEIRLLDYEYLTGPDKVRVVAFGRWAGVVGAYNGLRAFGLRSGNFDLPPASSCKDLEQLLSRLRHLDLGKTRIALTGGGRVAAGALEILEAAGLKQVKPEAYLSQVFDAAVYTRLDPWHYTCRKDGLAFDFKHFVAQPYLYKNSFLPYARRTDMFIACHYWDPQAPVLLSRKDLMGGHVPIRIVADISCDIEGPIPSTIRASTIAEPFYGYDPVSGKESAPFERESITVMAVDNLPGELPRDASEDFGQALSASVIPEILGTSDTGMVKRACIAEKGRLTKNYAYLQDYLEGRE
ncbi:MAG: NAD(P)-dependent oxidoreductase [Bacteroidota bacterium]